MGQAIRILSANLWNGRASAEGFADLVMAVAADIVCVQELAPEQAELLSEVMPYGELEPARNYTGMGIALRAPADISRVPLDYRDARRACLDPKHWPGLRGPLEIVNLHVAAPHQLAPFGLATRIRQMRSFGAFLDGWSAPQRAVLGDFNATPAWPVYRRISSQLTDAAVKVARRRDEAPRATWGPWSGSPRFLRIDHALVSGLEVEDFRVLDIPGSDHDAIVVDLTPESAPSAGRNVQSVAEETR